MSIAELLPSISLYHPGSVEQVLSKLIKAIPSPSSAAPKGVIGVEHYHYDNTLRV